MAKRTYFEVLTLDVELNKYTPQKGVRRGPYTFFGLRKAVRKLRSLGYSGLRDNYVYVDEWLPPTIATGEHHP